MQANMVVEKFYEALKQMDITYDKETGRLSKPLIIIVYDDRRKMEAKRLFPLGNHFIVIDDEKQTSKRIYYNSVHGFQSPNEVVDI